MIPQTVRHILLNLKAFKKLRYFLGQLTVKVTIYKVIVMKLIYMILIVTLFMLRIMLLNRSMIMRFLYGAGRAWESIVEVV